VTLVDTERSIVQAREALENTSPEDASRLGYLGTLADDFEMVYLLTGNTEALDRAIELGREALKLLPNDDSNRAKFLADLSGHLDLQFDLTGNQDVLTEAIALARAALDLTPNDHNSWPTRLSDLSGLICDASKLNGDVALTAQGVALARRAVEASRLRPANRAHHISALAAALIETYHFTGDRSALEEAVSLAREALDSTSPTSPNYDIRTHNLAVYLYDWYHLTGIRSILDKATVLAKQAAHRIPRDHVRSANILNSLAACLLEEYRLEGNLRVLEESLNLQREVVALTREGIVQRATFLSNLGANLRRWYAETHEEAALVQAVQATRESVRLTPSTHIDRPDCLRKLSISLRDLFNLRGDRGLLSEAIDLMREAITLSPPDYYHLHFYLSDLADLLEDWYLLTGERGALHEAVELIMRAIALLSYDDGALPHPRLRPYYLFRARLLVRRHDPGDLKAAVDDLEVCLDLDEEELINQPTQNATLDLVREREDAYRQIISLCFTMADLLENQVDTAGANAMRHLAWCAVQQSKGRLLASLLGPERRSLAGASSPEIEAIEREIAGIREAIVELEARLRRLPSAAVEQELQRKREERKAALTRLDALDQELASLAAARPQPVGAVHSAIQSVSPGALLVEFYPLFDRLAVFALHLGKLWVSHVPLTFAQLYDWTLTLQEATQDVETADIDQMLACLDDLGATLAPVFSDLLTRAAWSGSYDRPATLMFAPTGPLHHWPLHLLPWRDGILWDMFSISYVPTADTLVYCTDRHPGPSGAPLLLAPEPSLPGTFAEAVLAKHLHWNVASAHEAIPELLGQHTGDFALSTHVEPNPDEGMLSQIKLGRGWVSALELLRILRARPDAEHGSLGSCAAHYEVSREGDHLQGLTRSLLAAGLRSFTSSLWPMDDLAACYLCGRTAELIYRDGYTSKSLALRQAALELRAEGWVCIEDWLYEHAKRVVGEERALLLGIAAVCCLREGDVQGFHENWKAHTEALADALIGPYRPAIDVLHERYEIFAEGWQEYYTDEDYEDALVDQEEEMTEWHWASSILIGVPTMAPAMP
jgi:tetratricopeptide (TPR) repeat protein